MLTITLNPDSAQPLYEQIYLKIRADIISGELEIGARLPSKRQLAQHLQLSVNTVENAYAQLLAEGYLESAEKRGYFVRAIEPVVAAPLPALLDKPQKPQENFRYDLKTNAVDTAHFPFSVWSWLGRISLRDDGEALLAAQHIQGNPQLRQEIARYLKAYRGMEVSAEQIVLGSGIEHLLGLIAELLPEERFAFEHPCYLKQLQILQSRQVPFTLVPVDSEGIRLSALRESGATAALITPARHFPLGIVMSINRRMQLLKWAAEGQHYLIEDDFDSEFRYALRQIPTLYSLDTSGRVIYLNTFARTLAPSLRIAYMVLPPALLRVFEERLQFYSCTVSAFEQSVLSRFLHEGYYERHLSRMRVVYRKRRDAFLQALAPLRTEFDLLCHEAGLHLLVRSKNGISEQTLVQRAKAQGIRVYGLSGYYWSDAPETQSVIIGYGRFCEEELEGIAAALIQAWL